MSKARNKPEIGGPNLSEVRCQIPVSPQACCPVCGSQSSCDWVLWDSWPIADDSWRPKKFRLVAPFRYIEAFYCVECRWINPDGMLFYAADLDAIVP